VLSKLPSHEKRIWDLVAYLGRYGHQPASVSLQLPIGDMRRLAESVNDLVKEESDAARGGEKEL
jgi:hypothetical protein